MSTRTTALTMGLAVILSACGGGDGGGDQATPAQDQLLKYVGTYTGCDDHEKTTMTLSAASGGALSMASRYDVYQSSDCTGSLLGSRTLSAPATLTFIESVPTSGAGYSAIDKILMTAPQRAATMTGPGVVGQCVNYPGGQLCYEDGAIEPAASERGGFALGGTALNVFELDGSSFKLLTVLTKN
jgi:hypothetical protein